MTTAKAMFGKEFLVFPYLSYGCNRKGMVMDPPASVWEEESSKEQEEDSLADPPCEPSLSGLPQGDPELAPVLPSDPAGGSSTGPTTARPTTVS